MKQSNAFFETARPIRLFLIVALPGLVSMLAASLYSACEGAFVGHLLGETAFAAVNIAMPIVMINFALADLIGVGSSVPISVALGRKDHGRANNIFSAALIMIFLAGIAMGALIYFSAPLFAHMMGAEGDLALLAVRYVRIFALLSPVTTIVFATDNYLRISGFVKGSMFLNILMTVLTVLFLFLFLAKGGMDVEGSALASCLSMFTCAVIALIPFVAKKSVLRLVRPKFSFRMVAEIVTYGMPVFLNNIAGRVTAILLNAALLQMGGNTAVAAYSVLMYSAGLVEPMLYGLSDSVQPAVGYNWGAGSLSRVRDITKCSLSVCGLISLLSTALLIFLPQPVASLFVDAEKDPALMEMSVHALRYFGTAFLFCWFSFAIQGFFGAIEKPLPATVLSIARALVFPVLLIYTLRFMGLEGLWLNYTGTSILTAILAVIMLLVVQRKMKRDIERGRMEE